MPRSLYLLLFGVLLAAIGVSSRAATPGIVTAPPVLNDAVAGQALAADLRSARPAAPAEYRGLLKIRHSDGSATSLPLLSRVTVEDHSWQSLYQVRSNGWTETLAVRHRDSLPTEYRYAREEGTNGPGIPTALCERIAQPFAGSDFSLADLGLEFYHWPTQVLVMNEMRKSRACHVLESRPAVPREYGRVVSWVDVESGGLLMAEAYDDHNRRVKEFEVKRFKKVGEQWQLQEIEMRQARGGSRTNTSRTVIEFDVSEQPPPG
jgi:hypothetical protein